MIVIPFALRLDECEDELKLLFRMVRCAYKSVTLVLAGSKAYRRDMEPRTKELMG